ncbi:MAG: RNA pseudouridine synthase [Deltaproteobacteria bacterium]|nr:RNA pseudouridine synthase [Deltaproteobacteria bacterium]HCH63950.1 RNA pseudouridine synthase [Deltaproteobacteria bacterium]
MDDSWTYTPPVGLPTVLHHDRDMVVIDKPSGLLSVPGRAVKHKDSAESRLRAQLGTVYPAHRLDLDTSGVLVFATRRKAERELFRQFRERLVQKTYLAMVSGCMKHDTGLIDLPLRRLETTPRSVVCHANGRPARTRYRVRYRTPQRTCVELYPETGRSHQLRIHLLSLAHPILGDRFYAPARIVDAAPRLMLHAWKLTVQHPFSGQPLTLEAPPPFAIHPPEGPS